MAQNNQRFAEKIASTFSVDVRKITSVRLLDGSHAEDAGRVQRYRAVMGLEESVAPTIVGMTAQWNDGVHVEYLGYVPSTALEQLPPDGPLPDTFAFLQGRCDITYEDLSPSQCIEYCFPDEEPNPTWHLSKTSHDGYEHFLQCKFKVWEKALREPSCEAAFRRMLQRGLVYQMYDSNMFPTPDHLLAKYRVTDDSSGKVVELPHPVARCRVWNADAQTYDEMETKLAGAPKDEDEAKVYWEKFLDELRDLRGKDYINSLLDGTAAPLEGN